MALFLPHLLLFMFISLTNGQANPPSPGYNPSSMVHTIPFDQAYNTLWGPQNQRFDHTSLTIWLDKSSGSGFKSRKSYKSGYFGTAIKLHPGYTAGVITSFYFVVGSWMNDKQLSNNEDHPGHHDEVDIEFLGTTPGKPYTLQTNVYIRGSGDGNIIGREQQFHLWFDPTEDFHQYAMLWTPKEIIFFVDDVPIRRYPRKSDMTFPLRPMYMYGSIWDASSWATEKGRYKANYEYQPFVGRYSNFKLKGCTTDSQPACQPPSGSPATTGGLNHQQVVAMKWVQRNYKVYDYCSDPSRDHAQTPEC